MLLGNPGPSMTTLTDAQLWALKYIVANPDRSPADIGAHCAKRPGLKHAGNGILRSDQGFGRFGAMMTALLRTKGLVTTRQHPGHGKYSLTRPTLDGIRAVRAPGEG